MTETISLEAAAQALRSAMRDAVRRYRIWYLIQAGLMILGGIVALLYPLLASIAVVTLLAWLLILSGIVQAISLIGASSVPNFWLQLVSVALGLIIGFLLLREPAIGVVTLALLLIVFLMIEGIAKVVFALTIRPLANWLWVLASGAASIGLAIILIADPSPGIWLLGLLFGVHLIGQGLALGYLAWHAQ